MAERIERTVLSGVNSAEFPHAFAVREAIRSWSFLQLNPSILREPSSLLNPASLYPDGRYLPNVLARIQSSDPLLLQDIARDLANIVPGLIGLHVEEDRPSDRYTLWATMEDGRSFSARLLSDGTLRMLALVTLAHDPQHQGVLCLEEPENGVHAMRMERIADLLCSLATDMQDPADAQRPLRQLLVNTHSPALVKQPSMLPALIFAQTVTSVDAQASHALQRVTRMAPVIASTSAVSDHAYALDRIIEYLTSADAEEAVAELRGARRL
ncbi:AAA family ATPase [Candidatus Viridilinea mediisalina]|uniref:AAA family ATPase n=1 Tax=Candidatus Viridilinea mediisalina TaxID=2024553 RepID=UPI0013FD6D71|nr:AAA family ATPase [Candidatus Viridilinea mediisalina]